MKDLSNCLLGFSISQKHKSNIFILRNQEQVPLILHKIRNIVVLQHGIVSGLRELEAFIDESES